MSNNPYLNLIDDATPTGLSAPKDKPNPYMRLLDDEDRRTKGVLAEATKINPDQAARAGDLSRRTGLPADMVRRNLEDIQRRQRVVDLMSTTAASPVLRAQLSNPEFAALAHDDAENLAEGEKITSVWGALGIVPRGIASALPAFNKGAWGLAATAADLVGAKDSAEYFAKLARSSGAMQKRWAGPTGGWLGQQVQGASNSIGLALPGIAATVYTGGAAAPAVTAAFLTPGVIAEGGDSALRARDKGLSPTEQARFAALNMTAEAVFERIPASKLVGDIAKGTGLGRVLMGQIATEVPTEIGTTLFQNLNEWATINPDKSFGDFLAEQPAAVRDTVVQTILGAGGTTAIAVGAQTAANRIAARGAEAEATAMEGQLLEQLGQIAEASKLRERSPESFAAFVNAAAEESTVTDVYVDGRVLAQALQQAPAEVQQKLGGIEAIQSQLGEAIATGGDVRIPVGDFVANFTGTGLEQSLINDIRTSPDGMTRKEAETFLQSDQAALLQEEVQKVVAKQADRSAFEASMDVVKEQVLGQLTQAGRFTRDVNNAYATLFSNFYGVMGAKIGLTPEQMAERYPIRIQAEGVTGGRVLDQTGANPLEAFRRESFYPTRAVRLADGTVLAEGVPNYYPDRLAKIAEQIGAERVEGVEAGDPRMAEGTELWATRPTVNEDGTVTIEHWGPKGLTKTDPNRWGESGTLPASERSAMTSSLPRTYFGIESGKPGGYIVEFPDRTRYAARVPADKLYDIQADPDGLKPAKNVAELERKIKDAGYLGYWTGNDQLGLTATMFDEVDVREVGETGRPVATREDFTPEGIANILERDNWAIFTAENPMAKQLSDEENAKRQAQLKADLDEMGVEYMDSVGRYAGIEHPFVVMGITQEQAVALGAKYEQDSVLTRRGLLYPRNGEVDPAVGVTVHSERPNDFFTEIADTGVLFTIDIDFEARAEQGNEGATLFQGGTEAYTRREPATAGEATGVPLVNTLASAAQLAKDNRFKKGRDFKVALQERAKAAGVDLSGFDDETAARLADYVYEDALEAVQDNQNAIGWYDRAVTEAKQQLARLYPEIATDPESEFAFVWALAVTSNGLKVDKNFELAAKAYEAWKANGEFPTNIGIGEAKKSINDGLTLHKVLISKFGSWQKARDFMVGERTVKENEVASGIEISGESKKETVRGAAILGPKIGNGFFSNLYGYFDALTMDRWLIRSVGRWRGTLIQQRPELAAQKRTALRELAASLDARQIKFLNGFFNGSDAKLGKRMTNAKVDALAVVIAKRSTSKEWRGHINNAIGGEELRKLGNGLAKDLDGQVEQPQHGTERTFLRKAFGIALERLRAQPGLEALTMADLQALLWYPEKLLYETAKKPAGKEVKSYADDEAPDYANAARKLVETRLGRAGSDRDGPSAAGPGPGDQQGAAQAGTLNQSGFRISIDNPGGEWLDRKQAGAAAAREEALANGDLVGIDARGLKGSTTAQATVRLPVSMLANLEGVLGENPVAGTAKYDALARSVDENGFDQKSPVMVWVNHFGEAFIYEGNNRVRIASERGIESLDVEIQWRNGAEAVDGPFSRAAVREALTSVRLNQGETQARGQIQFPADITQDPSVITLLQKADLSTFLHESGHFFLEVMTDMASRGDAPQQVIDDMNSLLKWFGVDSILTWKEMTLEQRRESHEKFARGFEAYLFEGKSPNVQMQGIFQRFRSWLVNVYRSLTALNVELNDEVRSVMDRMLATPEMINEAEQARGMQPLFASAEEAGMSEEEFAAYSEQSMTATEEAIAQLEARSLRDMQWLGNAKSRYLKQLQADAAEKRAAIRKEVIAEVMGERVNRAREFLKRGVLDGQPFDGPTKMSITEVEAIYADRNPQMVESIKNALGFGKYGMLARENAINPEQVAELFGYTSADEMIMDLVSAEDAKAKIDGLTDQRMLERYGDISSPEALSRAADKALHGDARQRFVATELSALNRLAGRPRVLVRAVKQFAEQTVARLRVRDVRPGQYAAAEARAAKASAEAMRKGDTMLAAQEKQNQLVQSHAARAAYDAVEEVEKGLRYLRKFSREGSRKSIDVEYLDQIDQLLERFELKAQSNKALDKRASFNAWLEAQRAMGLEPDIPAEILNTAGLKNYREATVEEFRGLVDTVKQVEHLGRMKKRLLTAKDKRDLDAAAGEIAASVTDNATRTIDDLRTRDNLASVAKSLGKQFLALHRKMASLARQMDGSKDGGPVWEYFIRSMNARGDKEAAMRAKATAELSALVKPLLAGGKMGGKGKFYPTLGNSFNREERIAIALNLGNAGNMQRLLDGEGWTIEDLQPLLDDITAEEALFVQGIWDYFESFRPEIAAKERRVYGKEPSWVEPVPVSLGGQNLRGGYYPVKYDPARSAKAEQHADAEEAKAMLRGAYTSATTRRSFTKQRADEVHGRPLLYTLAGLYQGTTEVIHDLAWHEWLIDVNRLLRHKAVDRAMRVHYGPEGVGVFKTAIQDIARGDVPAQNPFERAVNHLRIGTTIAGMGWNLMTSLLQPLGLSQSMVRVGPGYVAKGLRTWLGSPIDTVGEISDKSTFMRLRSQTMQREINEIRNQVRGQSSVANAIESSFFILIQKAQMIADVPTWLGAYEKAIEQGNDENRAVALADQAVRDAQGGGQINDLAGIQRGGPLQKLFTNFYSYFNTTYNLAVERTAATDFKKPGQVARLSLDYLLLFTVPAVLGALLKEAITGGGDDDEDTLAKKLINEQLSYLFGTMVGLRELTGAAQMALGTSIYDFGYTGPAGLRFFAEANKLGKQIDQGEWDRALRASLVNVAGIAFHLPSGQINRTWDGIEALADDKTDNPAVLVVGPPR